MHARRPSLTPRATELSLAAGSARPRTPATPRGRDLREEVLMIDFARGRQGAPGAAAPSWSSLPSELQAQVLSYSGVEPYSAGLRKSAMRPALNAVSPLCTVLRANGLPACYVADLAHRPNARDLLRRQVCVEAGWLRRTDPATSPGVVRYQPQGSDQLRMNEEIVAVLAPYGASFAYFSYVDFRVHVTYLNYGVTRPPSYALPQSDRPLALAYGAGGSQLFVVTNNGLVQAYAVPAVCTDDRPTPLGELGPNAEDAARVCRKLVALPKTGCLVGMTPDRLLVWDVGYDHDGSLAGWMRPRAQATALPALVDSPLRHLVEAPGGAQVATVNKLGRVQLAQLGQDRLYALGRVGQGPDDAGWLYQSLAFDARDRLLGQVSYGRLNLFDLRIRLDRASVAFEPPAQDSLCIVQPQATGRGWVSGSDNGGLWAYDVAYPRAPRQLARLGEQGAQVDKVQLLNDGSGAAVTTWEKKRRYAFHVAFNDEASTDQILAAQLRTSTALRNLAIFPQQNRFFAHTKESIVIWQPRKGPALQRNVDSVHPLWIGPAREPWALAHSWARPVEVPNAAEGP